MFWTLYSIDRKLIFPEHMDAVIPVYVNHIMHTLPLGACLIDNILTRRSYPKFFDGFKYTAMTALLYLAW